MGTMQLAYVAGASVSTVQTAWVHGASTVWQRCVHHQSSDVF